MKTFKKSITNQGMGRITLGTLTKRRIAAHANWKCHILVDKYYEVDPFIFGRF